MRVTRKVEGMSSCLFRIQFADGRIEDRPFPEGNYRIGREAGDIVLQDPSASAVHGELVVRGGSVTYTDLGSSNGSFDAQSRRLTGPTSLAPGQSVRLGASVLTFIRPTATTSPAPMAQSVAVPRTVAMPQASAVSAARAPVVARPADAGSHSHPEQAVRHSYPLAIQSAGFGDAVRLLMQTLPFLLVRLGILTGLTVAAIVYWVLLVGGFALLAKATPLLGWAWVVALIFVGGGLWRFVVRYVLYLLKAAHIAVLTELITTGQVGNGSESMFHYGKRIVTERFGEVNVLFGLDMLIAGIVGAFNRTLDWIANLLPVPGLDSVMGAVRAVLKASTTYIDETILSYNIARGDDNVFRSSKDGLIYYAQNAKAVLQTGVWVVVLDWVLTFGIWVVMLAPAFVLAYVLPGTGTLVALVFAALFAANVRSAVLHPLFLIMVMVKFHCLVQRQPIDLVWDQRLSEASGKFGELKGKAEAWMRPGRAPQPASSAQPA
jgi:pSer/pThr/pTyr-binding forkhead associated (FHA) protein